VQTQTFFAFSLKQQETETIQTNKTKKRLNGSSVFLKQKYQRKHFPPTAIVQK